MMYSERRTLPASQKPARFRVVFSMNENTDNYYTPDGIEQVAKSVGVSVHSTGEVERTADGEDDLEVEADISSGNWEFQLLPLLRRFQRMHPAPERDLLSITPIISVPSKMVFSNQLISAHTFPVRGLFFGNFLNRGHLYQHWQISYTNADKKQGLTKGIEAEFAHDDAAAFFRFDSLEFETSRDNETSEANNREVNRRGVVAYTCRFFYKCVKRVVVDLECRSDLVESDIEEVGDPVRLHFVLSVPVDIFRLTQKRRKELTTANSVIYGDGDRFRTIYRGRSQDEHPMRGALPDCPVFTVELNRKLVMEGELYSLLSRLSHRGHIPIECGNIALDYGILSTKQLPDKRRLFYKNPHDPGHIKIIARAVSNDRRSIFKILFLIEGLLSRGAIVKDRILLKTKMLVDFYLLIAQQYLDNHEKCERALEDLIDSVEDLHVNRRIENAFLHLVAHPRERKELTEQLKEDGYMRIRKIVITPTRQLYLPAETMMGNRILREHGGVDGIDIIRVAFRDDSGGLMRQLNQYAFLVQRVEGILQLGLVIGGEKFSYLGQSNSQLRDQGAYFIRGDNNVANRIRSNLGKFGKLPNVAKIVARMGQCFTQSRESRTVLERQDYCVMSDFIGGSDAPTSGLSLNSKEQPYVFSDGVGTVSRRFLWEVAANSNQRYRDYIPSCIQFRFRGYKGVLTMEPLLDELSDFYLTTSPHKQQRRRSVDSSSVDSGWEPEMDGSLEHHVPKVFFRDSQHKFQAPRGEGLEVVKFSGPSGVALNRPLINILDQVSQHQSTSCHSRIRHRILDLLDRHVLRSSTVLIDENRSRDKLKELPNRLDIDALPVIAGFHLNSEPFFRTLLKTTVQYSLKRTLQKEQIEIPRHLGRSMFGVVDERGLLQYGQVFIQYTRNPSERVPGNTSATTLLTGPVMVTKNPSIVPGDVRRFEAVDLPELRHLVDVIVFPRHGPRPHPDEMAGSDLDGDEYSVFWDPDLLFEYNEEAMYFPKVASAEEKVAPKDLRNQMISHYVNYMRHDLIGMVSVAHLINSDLYGLFSPVAMQNAEIHSLSVDFPKTGVPAPKLTSSWTKQTLADGREVPVPPQRIVRTGDFMERESEPAYFCTRSIGILYRKIKEIQGILSYVEEKDLEEPIVLDPQIDCDGWEEFKAEAECDLGSWVPALQRELDHYGISSASELLTGCVLDMKNKAAEREADGMSYYTTAQAIESKMTDLWIQFRTKFFESEDEGSTFIGRYFDLTVPYSKPWADEEYPLHRTIGLVNDEMRKKAVAYYKVAYERAAETRSDRASFLAFPWLVWDVLAAIKKEKFDPSVAFANRENGFFQTLGRHMTAYCIGREEEMILFHSEVTLCEILQRQMEAYTGFGRWARSPSDLEQEPDAVGLRELLFFASEWAAVSGVYERGFRRIHICLLLLQFATGSLPHATNSYFTLAPFSSDVENRVLRNPGLIFYKFLEFTGSRAFLSIESLCFDDFGLNSCFFDQRWTTLHKVARRSFYTMVFSNRFEDLPVGDVAERSKGDVREDAPFTADLPGFMEELSRTEKRLIEKCGLFDLSLRARRAAGDRHSCSVRVSAMGTADALRKLHRTLTVRPIENYEDFAGDGEKLSEEYARRTKESVEREQEDSDEEED